MTDAQENQPVTLATLQEMQRRGEKIACLTCYDSSFTQLLEAAGVDMFIIGDSLGMVLKGYESTVPVTMAHMIDHAENVARVGRHAYRVVDMPYMSYATPETALANAARLVGEGGADMVKLEGGSVMAATVAEIVSHDIPVCGHIGLLPQSIEQLGGYKVQGRDAEAAAALLADAEALQAAGAGLLVMECIPAALAEQVTAAVSIPTIGIGAGPGCDGQVLVIYDMLGITPGKPRKFVRDFLAGTGTIRAAVEAYICAVKDGSYPAPEHGF
jgi:3-methyl-2-oxobutanoate hydroxymethyltransferase